MQGIMGPQQGCLTGPAIPSWLYGLPYREKRHDAKDGAVFQLHLGDDYSVITFVSGPPKISAGGDTGWKHQYLVFASPSRVDRTERQRSVFSLVSFENNLALQPIDQILLSEKPRPLRKFTIPARLKPELRRLLSDIGLDAYQLYGDPDSLGKSLGARLDLSGLRDLYGLPARRYLAYTGT